MEILCPSFSYGEPIPDMFSKNADGDTIPEIQIKHIPQNTQSLTLVMHDPDVPKHFREDGIWYHWIAANIASDTATISRGDDLLGVPCLNTSEKLGYEGPEPPEGETHRYFFTLYACSKELPVKEGAHPFEIISALDDAIVIEKAEYMGTYTSDTHTPFDLDESELEV